MADTKISDLSSGAPAQTTDEIPVVRGGANYKLAVSDIAALSVAGQSSSVDGEIALFSGDGGKTIKRASTTGVLKATSGVLATAAPGTDWAAWERTFTPLDNQPPATNFATLDTRNSVAVLDFDDTTEESAVFVGVLPAGVPISSGLKVRIFWMATSATSGNARWGAQFEKYGTDLDSDSFDTATEAHTACSGTSGIAVVTEITCTTIDSLVAGDLFRLKIYRDASDTTNDTITGDVELIAVQVTQA